MRLTLIVALCLLNAGCALWRKDAEEPVDNGPKQQKAEPVLKPSEALQPKSLEIASPDQRSLLRAWHLLPGFGDHDPAPGSEFRHRGLHAER